MNHTSSQTRIIAQITNAGYSIKTISMIGRKVWIVAEKNRNNVFLDESFYGTIGVRGSLELKYEQFTTRYEITEDYVLNNLLKRSW